MFDIRLIRSDPDRVKQAMKTRNKNMDAAVDEVLKIDAQRREILAKADGMKAQQNAASKPAAQQPVSRVPPPSRFQRSRKRAAMFPPSWLR